MTIRHKISLLQNIAAGLNQHERRKVCDLEVSLYQDGKCVLQTSVPTALDYLANDIYWNEENNWSEANIAEVTVL